MLFKLMLETAGSCMITHQVGNNRCSASATLGFRNSARLSPENLRPESPPLVPLTRARGSGKLLRSAPRKTRRRSELKKANTRSSHRSGTLLVPCLPVQQEDSREMPLWLEYKHLGLSWFLPGDTWGSSLGFLLLLGRRYVIRDGHGNCRWEAGAYPTPRKLQLLLRTNVGRTSESDPCRCLAPLPPHLQQ